MRPSVTWLHLPLHSTLKLHFHETLWDPQTCLSHYMSPLWMLCGPTHLLCLAPWGPSPSLYLFYYVMSSPARVSCWADRAVTLITLNEACSKPDSVLLLLQPPLPPASTTSGNISIQPESTMAHEISVYLTELKMLDSWPLQKECFVKS